MATCWGAQAHVRASSLSRTSSQVLTEAAEEILSRISRLDDAVQSSTLSTESGRALPDSAALLRQITVLKTLRCCLTLSTRELSSFIADSGEDAKSMAIELLGSIIDSDITRSPPLTLLRCITEIYEAVIDGSNSAALRGLALQNLADLLDGFPLLRGARTSRSSSTPTATSWRQPSATCPSSADAHLRIRGHYLAQELLASGMASQSRVEGQMDKWCLMLRLAINERNVRTQDILTVLIASVLTEEKGFPNRFAAVQSLHSFVAALQEGWNELRNSSLLLKPHLLLYDALNDDDCDIRDLAARTTATILSKTPDGVQQQPLVPLAASASLSNHLAVEHSRSASLCNDALSRLTGACPSRRHHATSLELRPVSEMLTEARIEDTSLFVEEKQNLFVDQVREARIWACVLKQISASAVHDSVRAAFESWVMSGLAHLAEIVGHEVDGPLGWTSKPDAFTLGMRVIHSAEVLLDWVGKGVAGTDERQVRDALQSVVEHGWEASLHELWLAKIDNLLADGCEPGPEHNPAACQSQSKYPPCAI